MICKTIEESRVTRWVDGVLTGKMTVFGAICEVNSSIGKFWDLLGHFDEKCTIDFKSIPFFIKCWTCTQELRNFCSNGVTLFRMWILLKIKFLKQFFYSHSGIGRCRHSSNFSNRQTPANTNSLNSGSGSHGSNPNPLQPRGQLCNCNLKKPKSPAALLTSNWPFNKLKKIFLEYKDSGEMGMAFPVSSCFNNLPL